MARVRIHISKYKLKNILRDCILQLFPFFQYIIYIKVIIGITKRGKNRLPITRSLENVSLDI